jgi:homoserine kinase
MSRHRGSTQKEVRVFAPASLSNLGTGFDVLGLAVEGLGDEVVARAVPGHGVRVTRITGDGGRLPLDPTKNTAGIAGTSTLGRAGLAIGLELEIHKGMPLGSGLGSSAASAVAAAFAVTALIGGPLRRVDLIEPCLDAEEAVAGRHASGDLALLARSIPDEIVTPARAALIPACREVIDAALDVGALGSGISGAGPSMFALCRSYESARRSARAMAAAFAAERLESTVCISPADAPGARLR